MGVLKNFNFNFLPRLFLIYCIYFLIITSISFAAAGNDFGSWGWWEKAVLKIIDGVKVDDYTNNKYEGLWCITKYLPSDNISIERDPFATLIPSDRWIFKNGKLYHLSEKQQKEIEILLFKTKDKTRTFIVRSVDFVSYEKDGHAYVIVGVNAAYLMGFGTLYELKFNDRKKMFLEPIKGLWKN